MEAASVERGGKLLLARRSISGAQLHRGLRSKETRARNPKLVVNAQSQNDGGRNGGILVELFLCRLSSLFLVTLLRFKRSRT